MNTPINPQALNPMTKRINTVLSALTMAVALSGMSTIVAPNAAEAAPYGAKGINVGQYCKIKHNDPTARQVKLNNTSGGWQCKFGKGAATGTSGISMQHACKVLHGKTYSAYNDNGLANGWYCLKPRKGINVGQYCKIKHNDPTARQVKLNNTSGGWQCKFGKGAAAGTSGISMHHACKVLHGNAYRANNITGKANGWFCSRG